MRKLFTLFIVLPFLFSCNDPVTEVKENIFSAQDNALVENEFNSTMEALTDWVANTKFYKKGERIVPPNVIISFVDSTFLDQDAVEGTLDFGPLGSDKPYGLLCSDGKYRAGKIHFSLNQPLEFPGTIFQLVCERNDNFHSGSGEEMNLLTGKITIENPDSKSLIIKAEKVMLVDGNGTRIEWSCHRIIRLVKDAGTGIWGDIYAMDGNASGVNRNGEKFEVTIEEDLIKKMEQGCSKTFVKGKLSIKNEVSDKIIRVNYDPFDNEACDHIAEAEINGKKTIFRLD